MSEEDTEKQDGEQEEEFEAPAGEKAPEVLETLAQFAERNHISVSQARAMNADIVDEYGNPLAQLRMS